jgi:hypothetical protein
MADAMRTALLSWRYCTIYAKGRKDIAMLELLMIANMARTPLRAIARRWYCKGLFRATRGQRRCKECGQA